MRSLGEIVSINAAVDPDKEALSRRDGLKSRGSKELVESTLEHIKSKGADGFGCMNKDTALIVENNVKELLASATRQQLAALRLLAS